MIAADSAVSAMIIASADDPAGSSGIKDSLMIDIFSPAGKTGTAILQPSRPSRYSDQCLEWPMVRVRQASGSRLAP